MAMHTIPVPPGLNTRFFIMGEKILGEIPELWRSAFPGYSPFLVADGNTWNAAGAQVAEILRQAGIAFPEPVIFPGTPRLHADIAYSRELAPKLPPKHAFLAIGSGVINDLCKCAGGMTSTPYCCVATAPSVDGYTSDGAALAVDGFKQTVRCPAPLALAADTAVLRSAPAKMLAAGYADLVSKVPAGTEWCIGDLLGIEPLRPDVWEIIHRDLRKWIADPDDLEHVFGGLAATGYSMQMMLDSRPASGAEHLMSHVWEMNGLAVDGEEVSHGFKVAIGILISAKLFEHLRRLAPEEIRRLAVVPATRGERFEEVKRVAAASGIGEAAVNVAMKKFLEPAAMLARREALLSQWDKVCAIIDREMLPFAELRELFLKAGVPTRPAEIGLDEALFYHGIHGAQLMRIRYTILDIYYELGLFPLVDGIVRPLLQK